MANTLAAMDMSPVGMLKSLPGWEQLSRKDQIFVEKETKGLGDAFSDFGRARLAIGERLSLIQDKLEPLRMFTKYLEVFHFKKSTAYNHINGYRNAVQWLPEPVLKEAMARNMPMMGISDDQPLGVYSDVVKRLPPPNTADTEKIGQYLDNVEMARKKSQARASKRIQDVEIDPDVLAKQCYRVISGCLSKLPTTGNSRRDKARQIEFVERVVGMTFADLGISSAKAIEPQAVPDGFRAEVGRPRKQDEAA